VSTDQDDPLAIGRLVDEYADAVARGDVEAFGRCWMPDGRWTGPGLECEGVDAIANAFAKLRGRIAAAEQEMVEADVTVEGYRTTIEDAAGQKPAPEPSPVP